MPKCTERSPRPLQNHILEKKLTFTNTPTTNAFSVVKLCPLSTHPSSPINTPYRNQGSIANHGFYPTLNWQVSMHPVICMSLLHNSKH